MSLPTWGIFMRKCYNDKTLSVSKKSFEKPNDLSINIDCTKVPDTTDEETDGEGDTKPEEKDEWEE